MEAVSFVTDPQQDEDAEHEANAAVLGVDVPGKATCDGQANEPSTQLDTPVAVSSPPVAGLASTEATNPDSASGFVASAFAAAMSVAATAVDTLREDLTADVQT